MGETLTEQRRVNDEVLRYVKFFYQGRMASGKARLTVLDE
jgi:hypothetical protein